MKRIILALLFSLLGVLSSRAGEAADQALQKHRAAAKASFSSYLATCPVGEIRCGWYLRDYHIGMLMEIQLGAMSVRTVREVFDWASQNEETRKLTDSGILSLKEILRKMPDSAEFTDDLAGVFVAWRTGDTVETRHYKRSQLPTAVRRIYDIGGGYIVTADDTEKEMLAGKVIIPPLNNILEGKLPMKLELKNTGKKPIRVCTLCMGWRQVSKGNVQVTLSPDSWKSDAPSEVESAKQVTTLQPGGTVEIPFEVFINGEKELRIEASYSVAPEFAGKLDLWGGEIVATPVVLVF